MSLAIDAQDLVKHYGRHQALRGVSLQVEPGELFGLLGPNGAGKTTLISILATLLDTDGGAAHLFGHRVHTAQRELRRLIGIVPQELAIYGELSARENLTFFGRLYGLDEKLLEQRVDELLVAVGLDGRANDPAQTFSGSMQWRLNLGAALVHRPKLVFLDEPTTGVDPQSRNHIFNEIRRLNAEGVTIIYTSHYMEEVQSLCARVAIMDHGQVVACDARERLLRLLPGEVRVQLPRPDAELASRLGRMPEVKVDVPGPDQLVVRCPDTSEMLKQLVPWLHELELAEARLQVEEPNLERVFLSLTGHALRD